MHSELGRCLFIEKDGKREHLFVLQVGREPYIGTLDEFRAYWAERGYSPREIEFLIVSDLRGAVEGDEKFYIPLRAGDGKREHLFVLEVGRVPYMGTLDEFRAYWAERGYSPREIERLIVSDLRGAVEGDEKFCIPLP